MQGITVEYQRFGGVTGILAPETPYLRTIGTDQPVEEASIALTQERLAHAMRALDYNILKSGDLNELRKRAEKVIVALQPKIEAFLPSEALAAGPGDHQLDIVARVFELAQLPFEVLEESHPKLIVTRRIRQRWPRPPVNGGSTPKVLFAWAEPKVRPASSRRMTVPHKRHLDLLDVVLRDWGGVGGKALVVEANVTFERLAARLAGKHGFTHVHLLAHGVPPAVSKEDLLAPVDLDAPPVPTALLALETEDGAMDRVPPEQLAAMLASDGRRPASFAIATCESADVDPISSGGTLAHALHAEGIPVVVASQLSLTKAGSDELISKFLARIIDGDDPRKALRACRDALRASRDKTFYDRVAVVGYVHLEEDFDRTLPRRKMEVALARLEAASKDAEARVKAILASPDPASAVAGDALKDVTERFASVRDRLDKLSGEGFTKRELEEAWGLRGSAHKREAQATWDLSEVASGETAEALRAESRGALRAAAEAYEKAARFSRDNLWTWVQSLVHDAIVRGTLKGREVDWITATAAAGDQLQRAMAKDAPDEELKEAVWTCGSLMELHLLAPLAGRTDHGPSLEAAKERLAELVRRTRVLEDEFPIKSTLTQLKRYATWWGRDKELNIPQDVLDRAAELCDHLDAIAATES